jgi:uncharacterized protein
MPGQRVFYHALNFNKVLCSHKEAKLLLNGDFYLKTGKSPNKALIRELKEKKLIIESSEEDDKLLTAAQKLIRKPYITTAYFFITDHCNLACKYCFEKQSVPGFFRKESMNMETARQGLQFFSKLMKQQPDRFYEKKTIIFYGGEPLMNRKILRFTIEMAGEFIEKELFPLNTKIIVVTNGTLLDKDDIDFFLKHHVTLTFSIDGDNAATENRVFQDDQPAFEQIVSSYKKCRDAGMDLNVACTLTPATLDRANDSVNFFIHELKIKNIGFNVLLDNGLITIPAEYDEVAAGFVVEAGKILNDYHINENRTNRRRQVMTKKQPCIFDCNAQGGRQIAIAPGGEVGICHEHIADREHFVTSVYEDFYPDKDPVYLEWNKRSPLFMEKCFDCPALGICGGGCVINTERATKSIRTPDLRFCRQTIRILESLIS